MPKRPSHHVLAIFAILALAPSLNAQAPSREPANSSPTTPQPPKPDGGAGTGAGVDVQVLPSETITPKMGDDARIKQMAFVKGVRYLLPIKWEPQIPDNPMRLAQVLIPPLSNEAHGPGLLVISGGIGGSVDENVARWIAQFKDTEGVPTQQDLQIQGSPLLVTQVIATGTFNAAMPGAEPRLVPNQTLYGAIVQGGPEGTIYFKAVGPKETMAERRVAWEVMVRNLRIMEKPRGKLPTHPGPHAPAESEPPPTPAPESKPETKKE